MTAPRAGSWGGPTAGAPTETWVWGPSQSRGRTVGLGVFVALLREQIQEAEEGQANQRPHSLVATQPGTRLTGGSWEACGPEPGT